MNTYTPLRLQAGRSLMEVMVAIAIGLIVSGSVLALYVSTYKNNVQSTAASRLTQEGSFALETLGRHIRQAGFGEINSTLQQGDAAKRLTLPPIHGCLNSYPDAPAANALTGLDQTCSTTPPPAAGTGILPSDGISLGEQVDASNPTTGAAVHSSLPDFDGGAFFGADCLGTYARPEQRDDGQYVAQVINRFTIRAVTINGVNTGSLYCQGTGSGQSTPPTLSPAQPIVRYVEQMRLTYLVSNNNTGEGGQYQTADQVQANNGWASVLGVRVCLLMSAEAKGSDHVSPNYTDCDGGSQVKNDSRLRRTFSGMFLLRNRAVAVSHRSM